MLQVQLKKIKRIKVRNFASMGTKLNVQYCLKAVQMQHKNTTK